MNTKQTLLADKADRASLLFCMLLGQRLPLVLPPPLLLYAPSDGPSLRHVQASRLRRRQYLERAVGLEYLADGRPALPVGSCDGPLVEGAPALGRAGRLVVEPDDVDLLLHVQPGLARAGKAVLLPRVGAPPAARSLLSAELLREDDVAVCTGEVEVRLRQARVRVDRVVKTEKAGAALVVNGGVTASRAGGSEEVHVGTREDDGGRGGRLREGGREGGASDAIPTL